MMNMVVAAAAVPSIVANPGFVAVTRPIDLGLYRDVLVAHGAWRWVVLIAGFSAVGSAAIRVSRRDPWAPVGPQLGRFFGIALDIQVLMGAALYLLLSPLTTIVLSTASMQLPPGSQAHYFVVTHPTITAVRAHQITVAAEHELLHAIPRLAAALVHADPEPHGDADFHEELASHRLQAEAPRRGHH